MINEEWNKWRLMGMLAAAGVVVLGSMENLGRVVKNKLIKLKNGNS